MTSTTGDWHWFRTRFPGLAAVGGITAVAMTAALTWTSSPMIWALAIGMVAGPFVRRSNVRSRAGTEFASGVLLKAGVALLGLSISLGQALSTGLPAVVIATATIAVTLAVILRVGDRLSIDSDLTMLIAFGSAICGASAIAAASATIRAGRTVTGYAVATITLVGTISMLVVPLLAGLIGLSDRQAGIWIGSSIQEVAQVAVAGTTVSLAALKVATLVKLVRVAMLPLALLATRYLSGGERTDREGASTPGGPLPLFVIAFLGFMLVRTLLPLPDDFITASSKVSLALQTAALAGIGLQIDFRDLRQRGLRPIALGLSGALVAITISLAGVELLT